VLTGP